MKAQLCKIPNWIKLTIFTIVSILIAILLETLLFQMKQKDEFIQLQVFSFAEKNNTVTIDQKEILEPLTKEEENAIRMDRENAKILAQINGTVYKEKADETLVEEKSKLYRKKISTIFTIKLPQKSFIRKIHLQYKDLEQNGNYTLSLFQGEHAVFEGIDGVMDSRLDAAVVTLNKAGDKIVYQYNSVVLPDYSNMQLSVVNIVNINWMRVLFIAICINILLYFITCRSVFSDKPEVIFAISALVLGSYLILCVGTNQIGYDEYVHATRAYEISFGSTIKTTESAMRMRGNDLPIFHNAEERKLVENYEEVNNDFSWADISTQSRFITYEDRSYLPIALFIKMGRILKMPFAWNMMFGKLGNLMCFTLLGYLAVKYAKGGKGIIAMLALLPNSLFSASVFTYDCVVNGFLMLAVVLTTNLIMEDKKKLTWIQVLLVLGAYIAGSTAKPIYIIMALLLVFLSQKRFANKAQAWGFRVAVLAIIGLLLYTIFFPPVSTNSNYELVGNLAYAGDKRNQGTSVIGQIQYIFSNPMKYSKLLLTSMFGSFYYYITGQYEFFNYGYLGNLSGIFTILGILILLFACSYRPEEEIRPVLSAKYKVLYYLMIFGVSAIIWTSMYVSYTAVGSQMIEGVQARYFIPLFLPFCYCIYNSKFKCRISEAIYNKLLIGSVVSLNLIAIYVLALKPLNF